VLSVCYVPSPLTPLALCPSSPQCNRTPLDVAKRFRERDWKEGDWEGGVGVLEEVSPVHTVCRVCHVCVCVCCSVCVCLCAALCLCALLCALLPSWGRWWCAMCCTALTPIVCATSAAASPPQAMLLLTLAWDTELHPDLPPLVRAWVRELLLLGIHGRFLFQTRVGGDAETGFVYALDYHVRPKYAFQDALNLVALGTWCFPPAAAPASNSAPAAPASK
jgi:hypothetical protein